MKVGESRKTWLLEMMDRAAKQNNRNTRYQLWQQKNHPIELVDGNMFDQRLTYIHNNPVAAGFIEVPCEWLYSSAKDYSTNEKGMITLAIDDGHT